jgi:hypothetical protein
LYLPEALSEVDKQMLLDFLNFLYYRKIRE